MPATRALPFCHVLAPDGSGDIIVLRGCRVSHLPHSATVSPTSPSSPSEGSSVHPPQQHPPHQQPQQQSLPQLCAAFLDKGVCPRGATCGFVHASLAKSRRHTPHVRAAATATVCTATTDAIHDGTRGDTANYPDERALVSRPNLDAAVTVRRIECLDTKAWQRGQPLALCAHFESKGRCNLGRDCKFVHWMRGASVTGAAATAAAPAAAAPTATASSETVTPLASQFGASLTATPPHANCSSLPTLLDSIASLSVTSAWEPLPACCQPPDAATPRRLRYRHSPYTVADRATALAL